MSKVPPIDPSAPQQAWSFRLTPEALTALRKAQAAGDSIKVDVQSSNPRSMNLVVGGKRFSVVPARITAPSTNVLSRGDFGAGISVLPQRLAIRKEGLTEADITRAKRIAEAEKPKRQTMEIRPGEAASRTKRSTIPIKATPTSSSRNLPGKVNPSTDAGGDKAAPEGSKDRVHLMHILAGAGRVGMDFTPLRERSGMGRNACQQTLLEIGKFTMIDRVWRLRQDQWRSIQPDWKHWSRAERKAAVEVQRSTLQALRVPVNDAIWDKVREAEERIAEEAPPIALGPSASGSSNSSAIAPPYPPSGDGVDPSGSVGPSGVQTGSRIAPGALGVGRRSRGGALGELKAKRAAAAKEEQKRKRLAAAAAEKNAPGETDGSGTKITTMSSRDMEAKGKKTKRPVSSLNGAPATFTPPKATFSGGQRSAKPPSLDSRTSDVTMGEKEDRQESSSAATFPIDPPTSGRSSAKTDDSPIKRVNKAINRLNAENDRSGALSEGEGGMDMARASASSRKRSDLDKDLDKPFSATSPSQRDSGQRGPVGWEDDREGYSSDGAPEIQRRLAARSKDSEQWPGTVKVNEGVRDFKKEGQQEGRDGRAKVSSGPGLKERRPLRSSPEVESDGARRRDAVGGGQRRGQEPGVSHDTVVDGSGPWKERNERNISRLPNDDEGRWHGNTTSVLKDGEATQDEVKGEDEKEGDEEDEEEEVEKREMSPEELGPCRVLEMTEAELDWPSPDIGLRSPKVTTQADLERLFADFRENLSEYTSVRQRLADRVTAAQEAGNPIENWSSHPVNDREEGRPRAGDELHTDDDGSDGGESDEDDDSMHGASPDDYDDDDDDGSGPLIIEGETAEGRQKRIMTGNAIMSPAAIWEWRRGKALESWLIQAKRASWEACRVNGWEVVNGPPPAFLDSRKRSRRGGTIKRRRRHRGEKW
ncbi:hypothetical protein BJ684DRAFT_15202 [Piptocephalis cylindrospora]|uniref:Uncharacterized protein n=1 Tax=Piptocephalis cylindrospora TaxID=1907219 RepID=A0A4P9Y848_9FUNG|nr:hypothetical protein BJ684DRAFT_15202 [Piptocephalis cylindrospora]|eukprot:RKP14481.1 hypothetical protein BJ684DRAFT_15202 [Piptocephalis cylindrospora]